MAEKFDIVIAGGGMVGVSLALQLGSVMPEATSILLVESFALPEEDPGQAAAYHPSFDARSTALSYSSQLIYERIGVWDVLRQWTCPIERIHVSSRGRFGSAVLDAANYDWPALGHVVENAWLGSALIQALHRQGRVATASPASVAAVEMLQCGVRLHIEGREEGEVEAELLVVADGANSGICEQLGVLAQSRPYGQHALIANVATDQPHRGMAFERFTNEGPIALLPLLPADGGAHRSALVWTLPPRRAQALLDASAEAFLAQLQERFGYRLGRMLEVGQRHSYPLSLVRSDEQVRQGVVVMGNAAHALHPVAGQGFNLALRDVAELVAELAQGAADGVSAGELALLRRYQARQRDDQERTIGFSDKVPGLFMHADPLLGLGRDLALAGLDLLPFLKREFVRHAAGVAAMGEIADG